MKQLLTRIDDSLAAAVKTRAALAGESVNAFVTKLLREATSDRTNWKATAVKSGLLLSRPAAESRPAVEMPPDTAAISTRPGYASALVSGERDDR